MASGSWVRSLSLVRWEEGSGWMDGWDGMEGEDGWEVNAEREGGVLAGASQRFR